MILKRSDCAPNRAGERASGARLGALGGEGPGAQSEPAPGGTRVGRSLVRPHLRVSCGRGAGLRRPGSHAVAMAAVAVLRNDSLQAFLQVRVGVGWGVALRWVLSGVSPWVLPESRRQPCSVHASEVGLGGATRANFTPNLWGPVLGLGGLGCGGLGKGGAEPR